VDAAYDGAVDHVFLLSRVGASQERGAKSFAAIEVRPSRLSVVVVVVMPVDFERWRRRP
jgi:hypothetical protein